MFQRWRSTKSQIFSAVRSQQGSHHLSVLQQNHAVTQTQAEQTLHQRSVPFRPTEHTRLRQRGGHHRLRGWGERLAEAATCGTCCSIGSFSVLQPVRGNSWWTTCGTCRWATGSGCSGRCLSVWLRRANSGNPGLPSHRCCWIHVLLCESVGGFFADRRLALQKERQTQASSKIHCCSRLKYYIIIVSHLHHQKQLLSAFYCLIDINVFRFKQLLCLLMYCSTRPALKAFKRISVLSRNLCPRYSALVDYLSTLTTRLSVFNCTFAI